MSVPYSIKSITTTHDDDDANISITVLDIHDRYHGSRHKIGRWLVKAYTDSLQRYLARKPNMDFAHKTNIARLLSYIPGGMRAWAGYMPGGFATYYVHEPDHKRMENGKKLDTITRSFFRHSYDSIGLRARSYILSWLVMGWADNYKENINWVSMGCGSGQPVYDVVRSFNDQTRERTSLLLVDNDAVVMEFARKLYDHQKTILPQVRFSVGDITNEAFLSETINKQINLVDMMGLFEYLSDNDSTRLLTRVYKNITPGGLIVFTNMRNTRPHLDVHKRAVGWPGVVVRSISDIHSIIKNANIPLEAVRVYTSKDGVYNVYRIEKVS